MAATAEAGSANTNSTSQEGEWELRDGKFFRKSTKTISAAQPQRVTVCQACPQKDREIIQLKSTVKQLQDVLASRDTMITSMRERIEKFEIDARSWVTERSRFESTISSLNRTIEELRIQIKAREDWVSRTVLIEKETIINNLQIRIRQLEQELENAGRHVIVIREKETHINNLQQRIRQLEGELDGANRGLAILREKETIISQLEVRIRELEGQLEYCRTNHTDKKPEPPPVVHTRWYYAVQNQQHAHLFQMHPRYQGGEVVVDSLEGATVVNPEYYTQSERVPGNARLRVRVVDATGVPTVGLGNLELFVRMRLGTATQFTQPRPISYPNVMWQQDFVFVGVPLTAHNYYTAFFVPQNPLIFELVGRIIGTSQEQIIGTGQAELSDLIVGLTRTIVINLDHGGSINVRIKALDFGLPNPEDQQANVQVQQTIVQQPANVRTSAVTTTYNVSNQELARKLDASDGAIDGHYGAAKINVVGGGAGGAVTTGSAVVGRTTYNVSDADMARRLDASDGVIDGKYGQANINVRHGSASGASGSAVAKTTYNVSSEEMARRLDAADGKIDGRFNNANINVKH